MASANYLLLCENFNRDNKNRASLINIFDVVGGEKLPIVPQRFTIALSVRVTKGDVKNGEIGLKIQVNDSAGKEVAKIEGNGKVDVDEGNVVSGIDLSGRIPFKKDGMHEVVLHVNGKKIAAAQLNVVKGVSEDDYIND